MNYYSLISFLLQRERGFSCDLCVFQSNLLNLQCAPTFSSLIVRHSLVYEAESEDFTRSVSRREMARLKLELEEDDFVRRQILNKKKKAASERSYKDYLVQRSFRDKKSKRIYSVKNSPREFDEIPGNIMDSFNKRNFRCESEPMFVQELSDFDVDDYWEYNEFEILNPRFYNTLEEYLNDFLERRNYIARFYGPLDEKEVVALYVTNRKPPRYVCEAGGIEYGDSWRNHGNFKEFIQRSYSLDVNGDSIYGEWHYPSEGLDNYWEFQTILWNMYPVLKVSCDTFSFLSPFAFLLYQLFRSQGLLDASVAIGQFINTQLGGTTSSRWDAIIGDLNTDWDQATKQFRREHQERFDTVISYFTNKFPEEKYSFEAGVIEEKTANPFHIKGIGFKKMIDAAEGVDTFLSTGMSSSVFNALRELVLGMASWKFFDKDVASQIYHYLGKPEKTDVLTLLKTVVANLIVLLKVGDLLVAGVPMSEVLLASDPILDLNRKMRSLLKYEDFLYSGMPVEGKMNSFEYVAKANIFISTGMYLSQSANPYNPATRTMKESLLKLQKSVSIIRSRNAGLTRKMPFAFLVNGPPGIGKSKIMDFNWRICADAMELEFLPPMVYSRMKDSDYFEGVDPESQPFLRYPEAGGMHPNLAKVKGDPMINEMTSIIDSQPYSLNMAYEAGKGKTWCQFQVVGVDTNNPTLNVECLVTNPAAIFRRMYMVTVHIRPEYKMSSTSCSLDPEKALASEFPLDVWLFEISRYVATNATSGKWEHVEGMDGSIHCDIFEYERVMRKLVIKHFQAQEGVGNKVDNAIRDFYKNKFVHEGVLPFAGEIIDYGNDLGEEKFSSESKDLNRTLEVKQSTVIK